jgi:opacity protein-like surface antigen
MEPAIDDALSVYGVLGATSGKVKVSLGSISDSSSKSSASFGAGLSYQITRSSAVSIEYARLYSDANALSVATRFNFNPFHGINAARPASGYKIVGWPHR